MAAIQPPVDEANPQEISNYRRNFGNGIRTCYDVFQSIIDRRGSDMETISFLGVPHICDFGIPEMRVLRQKSPQLRSLGLGNVRITPADLGRLGVELSQLEIFSFWQEDRPNDAIQQNLAVAVSSMPNLKQLGVGGEFDGSFLLEPLESIVNIILGDTIRLNMANLRQFIQSHPGLNRLQMSDGRKQVLFDYRPDPNFEEKCRETVGLLAQRCKQLQSLSFIKRGFVHTLPGNDTSLAAAFHSLTELKFVEFDNVGLFNMAALESLCANCISLEDLSMSFYKPAEFGAAEAFGHISNLKKLKNLKMNLPIVDKDSTVALWKGIGASLERLGLQGAKVTNASLRQIGRHCGCLDLLAMQRDRNSESVTIEGLKNFIKEVVNHPSWSDPVKNRRLQIDVYRRSNVVWPTGINVDEYGGRVKINSIKED